ncbi:metal-dependent hydrolase [Candidatus Tenderia electrophaga]|jgi:ABC-2 type transport system permease protein|uniref:Transport permease protein n=1 Tax=Candidatus Tenderia electrophaga TaxID=1748243 RepID=A0A0S2TE06_9GAMM|nr:metal-dependent hydrolase [Candidatus Tenderia electrophaga]
MNWEGLWTLFRKELKRFGKVALQTVLAPIVTALLYLLVFSHVLEEHVRVYENVSYTAFLIPGLMMMSMIQNAFANSSSSLIQSKVTGNIVFVLLTPLSYLELYLAFVLASVVRGMVVGLGIFLVASLFVSLPLHSVVWLIMFAFVSSTVLGTMGIIAGIWAEKFDHMAGFQNFIIMPLSFLSGVFYSIHSLPEFWQALSRFNPFFYMIDGFRYGFFGVSDVNPGVSLFAVLLFWAGLAAFTLFLLRSGYKLRD